MARAPKNCQSDPRFVGDPVDVVTGEMSDLRPDFVARGPIPFDWIRYYSSARCHVRGDLGNGYTHGFEHRLIRDLDGLRYLDPEDLTVEFTEIEIGEHQEADGVLLQRAANNTYLLTRSDQPRYEFNFDELGSTGRLSYAYFDDRTLEFTYAKDGRLATITQPNQARVQVLWTEQGLLDSLVLLSAVSHATSRTLIQYKYDAAGNLISAVDLHGTIQTSGFDASNRLVRRTDRLGYSFLFEYDELGRCIHSSGEDGLLEVFLEYHPESRMTLVRHGNGARWLYFYDAVGTITQVTDPYGFATKYVQDELGRTVKEIDPNGGVTQYHYNSMGQLDYKTDPIGRVRSVDEDEDEELGEPQSMELPSSAAEWEHGDLLYADEARLPESSNPVFSLFPGPVVNEFCGIFSPDERLDSASPAEFDVLAENLPFDDEFLPFAERSEFDANGNLIQYQDRDGSIYRHTYLSWNLPHRDIDPLGHTDAFVFGSNLELQHVIDAGGTEHKFVYDLKDRLTEIHYDGKLIETYVYDAADNLIEKRDAGGQILVAWELGPGHVDITRLLASGEVHKYEYNERFHIVKANSPEAELEFDEDENEHWTKDLRDALGVEHEFAHDELQRTVVFKKFIVEYQEDQRGDLVVVDPTGARHTFTISQSGLVNRRYADGGRELIQYDADGRCRRKAVQRGPDLSDLWMRSYKYSPEGDLRRVEDSRYGPTKFEYDGRHRLISMSRSDGRHEFHYTPAGSVLKQPGLEEVTFASGNRLLTANGQRFEYDARDNLVRRSGDGRDTTYRYDALDRLVECNIDGESWTASYDALDRRISKTWRGQTTAHYWDDFRLVAERYHDGSLRLYIYSDRTALVPFMFVEYDSLDAEAEAGRRYYIFADHLGTPLRVDDEDGDTVWNARIAPYGLAEISAASIVDMPLRFPGHYFDVETGLHYNRFRYYSPELGCYIQADPIGIEGGLNLFAYVENPLVEVDVDGLKKCSKKKAGKKKTSKKKAKKKNAKKKAKKARKKKSAKKNPSYERPSGFRKGVRDKVWTAARKKSKDGKVRDPVTKKVMKKSDPWDMGHRPKHEFRKHKKSAEKRKITRKKFLDEYNDPGGYRPELPSSNRGHAGEDSSDDYKGH